VRTWRLWKKIYLTYANGSNYGPSTARIYVDKRVLDFISTKKVNIAIDKQILSYVAAEYPKFPDHEFENYQADQMHIELGTVWWNGSRYSKLPCGITCGNGAKDNGEECDDKINNGSGICAKGCKNTFCGDGKTQKPNGAGEWTSPPEGGMVTWKPVYEECDSGKYNANNKKCNTKCMFTYCGDGVKQVPNGKNQKEECDLGSQNGASDSNCSKDCKVLPSIVNGHNCIDAFGCMGSNSIIFPVRNSPVNGTPVKTETHPMYCKGNWTMNTYQSNFSYKCSTKWVYRSDCDKLGGRGTFENCPAQKTKTFCGDKGVQTPNDNMQQEECDRGSDNGKYLDGWMCKDCRKIAVTTCVDKYCQSNNPVILTKVENTKSKVSNGDGIYACYGIWWVDTKTVTVNGKTEYHYDSKCSGAGDWQKVN
jgi:hypothetical protein